MKRREFLSMTGMIAAAGVASPVLTSCCDSSKGTVNTKNITKKYQTDVLICGGGPAGVCAAVAAAREGVNVMIVETAGFLGGMATRSLVGPFMTCFDSAGEQMIIRGLFEEVVDRMVAKGGALHPKDIRATTPYSAWITAGHDHCTPFEPECMKVVLDEMVEEAGVKVLFHSNFVEPILKGNKITGAVISNKAGFQIVEAKVVIDCTGDGDVAYRSGVPCHFGNENGKVQPSTAFFHINNVDSEKLEADVQKHLHEFRKVDGVSYRALHWWVLKAIDNGEWDIARRSVNIYKCVQPHEWVVNCSRIQNVDSTDPESMTAGEIEGRKQIQQLMNFFHKYVPGCENAVLMASGSHLGIRESRHIEGDYVLTAEDLLSAKMFEDNIFVTASAVDVHGSGGKTQYKPLTAGKWYGIPYRTLLPKNVEGLLVAGRCLSATSEAAGAIRVMPPVMAMGQAAVVAAALAVKNSSTPRTVDVTALQEVLTKQKVFLG